MNVQKQNGSRYVYTQRKNLSGRSFFFSEMNVLADGLDIYLSEPREITV